MTNEQQEIALMEAQQEVTATLPSLNEKQTAAIDRMPPWLRYRFEERVAIMVEDAHVPEGFASVVAFREACALMKRREHARKTLALVASAKEAFGAEACVAEGTLADAAPEGNL